MAWRIIAAIFMSFLVLSDGSHFLGGIITFRPTGNGNEVIGHIRTGWNSNNKYCNVGNINSGAVVSLESAACVGCGSTGDVTISLNGSCTGFSTPAMWTSFRSTFTVTPATKYFSLSLSGGSWVHFGNWRILTEADITVRNDNGKINNSPTVETAPIIYLQHGCHHRILLPVWDVDGDIVRCRFSRNPNAKGYDECGGLCTSYPNAIIEKDGCTLSYFANQGVGYYGVAIQVEDFANAITTQPLSSVAVQFLIQVYSAGSTCSSVPMFVNPTPSNGFCFLHGKGETFSFAITAYSASSTSISVNTVSPLRAPRGQEVQTSNQTGTYVSLNVSWVPTDADLNQAHHVCFEAVDSYGLHSEQRCVYLLVKATCQEPFPLQHGHVTLNESCPFQSAAFTCDEGFTLIGHSILTCRENGRWSADVPTCRIVEQILGESCVNPNDTGLSPEEHCSAPNTECTSVNKTAQYRCRCKPNYYDDNGESAVGGTCVQKQILGESCVNPNKTGLSAEEHCSAPNAVCISVDDDKQYICRCKPSYYDDNGESAVGGTCELKKIVGESCVNPNKTGLPPGKQCFDPNALCSSNEDATQYICRCKPNFYNDNGEGAFGGKCEPKQILGKSCENPKQTGLVLRDQCFDHNAVCTGGDNVTQYICRCKPKYYDDNGERTVGGTCRQKQILGETCVNPNKTGLSPEEHCSAQNAVCTSINDAKQYVCRCKPGYYDDNGESAVGGTCRLKQVLGESCVNPNDTGLSPEEHCSVPNSVCTSVDDAKQYVCGCKPNYYDDNGERAVGGMCEPKKGLGDNCQNLSDDGFAIFPCLDIHAECVSDNRGTDYVCLCTADFFDDKHIPGGKCMKKKDLGGSCVNPHEVGLSPEEQCFDPNAVCKRMNNGTEYICSCVPSYFDDNGEHTIGGTCILKRALGDLCQSLPGKTFDAIFPCLDINSECVSGNNRSDYACLCVRDYFDDNGDLIAGGNCLKKAGLGEICPDVLSKTDTCLDSNSVCSIEKETGLHKCACNSGFYKSDGKPGKKTCTKKHDLGIRCKGDFQCSTWQSACKFDKNNVSRCMCQNGYAFEKTSNTCEGQGVTHCPADLHHQISWENTDTNTFVYKSCPDGYTGFVRRYCDENGQFYKPSYNCSLEIFNDVLEQSVNKSINTKNTLNILAESLAVPERLYSGDINTIENILDIVVKEEENSITVDDEEINMFINITNTILDPKQADGWTEKISETDKGAETFLKVVDEFIENIAVAIEENIYVELPNIVLKVKRIKESESDIVFPDGDDQIVTERTYSSFSLKTDASKGDKIESLAIVVYKNVSDLISTRRSDSKDEDKEKTTINSEVMAINIFPKPTRELNPPLELAFRMFENVGRNSEAKCSFWDASLRNGLGSWSTRGCVKIFGNETVVKCQCSHLTNFAILVSPLRPPPGQSAVLSILSMVGCGITMTFLLLTIIANSLYWRNIKSDSNMIPMVLCISLFIGYCIFVFGINRTESKVVCTSVAVLLHYTFLLIFFLMLAEGLYITIRVVFIFHVQSHIKGLLIAAFVVPVIIVGITASVTGLDGYGDDQYCWFAHGSDIFWAFAAPAVLIVMVNIVILGIVLYKMYGTSFIQNMDFHQKTRTMAQKLAFLVPLLGLTWALGFLSAVSEDLFALQVLFLLCNLLQGPVFFVFHCLLNKQLKAAIDASIKRLQSLSGTSFEKTHGRDETMSSISHTGTTRLDKSFVSKAIEVDETSFSHEGSKTMQPIASEKSTKEHPPSKESLSNVATSRNVLRNFKSGMKTRLSNVSTSVAKRARALVTRRSKSPEDAIVLQIETSEETSSCNRNPWVDDRKTEDTGTNESLPKEEYTRQRMNTGDDDDDEAAGHTVGDTETGNVGATKFY